MKCILAPEMTAANWTDCIKISQLDQLDRLVQRAIQMSRSKSLHVIVRLALGVRLVKGELRLGVESVDAFEGGPSR